MNILEQYDKQNPQTKQAPTPRDVHEDMSEDDVPIFIRWTIKISRGYIKDEKQASYVLVGFVAVAIVVSLILIFGGSAKNTLPPKIMDDTFKPTSRSIKN